MALDDPDLPMNGVVPSKEELKDFMTLTIRQPRPDLEFTFMLPDGWYKQPSPPDRPDLSNEAEFASLGVFTPTKEFVPPIVFSVGARPAPKKGTVAEWLEKQCHLQQLALQRMTVHEFLFGYGVDAVALQSSDIGPLKLRLVMFEDGGRLFVLTAMAPLKLWDTVVATLSLAILSFELIQPKGQTVPVLPKPDPDDGAKRGESS
jgi:hypothetical protein